MQNTQDVIIILDFGSQYSQLIARKLRELAIYCELFPWDISPEKILALNPKGFILSGGPKSVYENNAPTLPDYILKSGAPILGICYGMQLLTYTLGGVVSPAEKREYGSAEIEVIQRNPLLSFQKIEENGFGSCQSKHPRFDCHPKPSQIECFSSQAVEHLSHTLPLGAELQIAWMSHGDHVSKLPEGFINLAKSDNCAIAAIGNFTKNYYGVQFHPEVNHTVMGKEILKNFAINICKAKPNWTADLIIQALIKKIQDQVGNQQVLAGISGGVDSTVAAALVRKAIGQQLTCVFVDNGLLRQNEKDYVEKIFKKYINIKLITDNAIDIFINSLKNIINPEQKRKIIGEVFIRRFEAQAKTLGNPPFLLQGTIYPDIIESAAKDRSKAECIKTHHNVGGLPSDLSFELVEPLRYLFKDEVRKIGEALGLPKELVWRQPFPGPGLGVRCLGEITEERLACLRAADAIFREELENKNLNLTLSQYFAVLLPVKSVGVMGDQRTYQEVIALRAVATDDFMTATAVPLPYDLLSKVANRIINEVKGVNRVVYDITSKPPATIEWE